MRILRCELSFLPEPQTECSIGPTIDLSEIIQLRDCGCGPECPGGQCRDCSRVNLIQD